MMNTEVIDGLIYGRVEPHIYAFRTATVPNYLKVGDTYRPVSIRLNEWRKYFPNLESVANYPATTPDKNAFFRDFAVHMYLENEKQRRRLMPGDINDLPYYSREFFESANESDIQEALDDILDSYKKQRNKYSFYRIDESHVPLTLTYERNQSFNPRPNQQATIDKFKSAIANGRTNLLMFAVMRFGKSFTSMCCATEMDAKLVVIVSAKADVKNEWKYTVESHKRFDGFEFLDSDSLVRDPDCISAKLNEPDKKVAVFLTLQDLQGEEIKDKHKDLFKQRIDLLIIDETHFAARAEKYGQAISLKKAQMAKELEGADEDISDLNEAIKVLQAKIRVHLSGTPYRILMGDEFRKEDIIAFYQFTDIVKEQEEWNSRYLQYDTYPETEINGEHQAGEAVKEWHNPYYGFPQMIRFAFNPNEKTRKRIEELRSQGITSAFSELFKATYSTYKYKGKEEPRYTFKYKKEILELFKVIDGREPDDQLLGFLDYEKIKSGSMCHHIVCVLPYRISCDALEQLISQNKSEFDNLSEYVIINVAGFNREKRFDNIQNVVEEISRLEKEGKKTISLTVNRMLTGVTVKEWDTMLFLKDTASPQEYDQAIFRLQSQYVKTLKDENGDDTIRFNMKPQTLLVDFSPSRMFEMQELKSKIYDVNVEKNGNSLLEQRIAEELRISPIVTVNAENKLVEVTPTNIMDEVRKYSETRSVLDEAQSIRLDSSLLMIDDIREALKRLSEIDDKSGLKIKPNQGGDDDDELDVPDPNEPGEDGKEGDGNEGSGENSGGDDKPKTEDETVSLMKKLKTFYAIILFYSFLTDSRIISLSELIESIPENEDNKRIAKNLGIKATVLSSFFRKCNPFIISDLDYKIQNINDISHDEKLSTEKKVEQALNKFGKLSISEIVTPLDIAIQIVSGLPEEVKEGKILDIASKEGEFAIALYKRFGAEVRDRIYAIPTSTVSYEFTRKIFKLLDMPVEHIIMSFNSYDLFKLDPRVNFNEKIIQELDNMKFSTIIGNPPYQEMDEGHGASSRPIYHHFVNTAIKLNPEFISIIMPARWYAGGKGGDLVAFRKQMAEDRHLQRIDDFANGRECFANVEIKGGVCYFLWSREHDSPKCRFVSHSDGKIISDMERSLILPDSETIIRFNEAISILEKVRTKQPNSFNQIVSSRKPFGLATNFKDFSNEQDEQHPIFIYAQKAKGYASPDVIIRNHEWKDKYKIYIPEAIGAGNMTKDVLKPIIGLPNTICTETYILIGPFDTEMEARNVFNYIRSKFFHFMLGLKKNSQHTTQKEYVYVPMMDFSSGSKINWSLDRAELDQALYEYFGLTEAERKFIEKTIPNK